MNEQQASERRAQLGRQLRASEQQMQTRLHAVTDGVRQSVSPAALVERSRPLLPFIAVAAVGGLLLLRLGGRKLRFGLLLPMALQAWRVARLLRGWSASPAPRALPYKEFP